MIEAIIFDFDGVILDSESIHCAACNLIFEPLGFTVPYDQYLKKYVGIVDREMFPRILQDYGGSYQPQDINQLIIQKIRAYKEVLSSSSCLYSIPGLSQFIENISKHISKFAICSGSTRTELLAALDRIENGSLKKHFDIIVTCEDVKRGKPSPEGYLKAAKHINVAPENCLVIEDTKIGILAGKAANMKVIGIATTNTKEALVDADFVVEGYEEIEEIILKFPYP